MAMDKPLLPCDGDDCPRKLACRRFLEREGGHTVLFSEPETCEIFEPVDSGQQTTNTEK